MIPDYDIRYSPRKTLSISITRDAKLRISSPIGFPLQHIHAFIEKKKKRILTKIKEVQQSVSSLIREGDPQGGGFDRSRRITPKVRKEALSVITQRVEHHAAIMHLSYQTIKISTARRRRGSCTSKRNLIFNRKLTQFPLFILDYVVIHELAHLVHFNHSPKFRSLVEQYCPDYKSAKKRLREHERGAIVR